MEEKWGAPQYFCWECLRLWRWQAVLKEWHSWQPSVLCWYTTAWWPYECARAPLPLSCMMLCHSSWLHLYKAWPPFAPPAECLCIANFHLKPVFIDRRCFGDRDKGLCWLGRFTMYCDSHAQKGGSPLNRESVLWCRQTQIYPSVWARDANEMEFQFVESTIVKGRRVVGKWHITFGQESQHTQVSSFIKEK